MPGTETVTATRTAVAATAHPAATAAALEILREGGNAVDAAVAAAWALAVCEPSGSGLGGQATMLIHLPGGEIMVLDGHSHAPARVTRRRVSRAEQRRGPRATTVPSQPATLGAALARHGSRPLSRVMAPAIRLAADGFAVTHLLEQHIRWCRAFLAQDQLAARVFLRQGEAPEVGSILRQPELAATLSRIAEAGVEDFYCGEIAAAISRDMVERGGLLDAADLAAMRLPVVRRPMAIDYRGARVVSVPPPGGGLQLLLALRVLDQLGLDGESNGPDWYAAIARITRLVVAERDRWPLDGDAIPDSWFDWQLGDARARELARLLREGRDAFEGPRSEGPGDTTHLCVADATGMVVSLTQSVQSLFGAKVAHRTLGFFYNNYLCTCPRIGHPNQLRPGASPQSNAAPTLVLRPRAGGGMQPVLAIGAAGSRRITSSIFQVLAGVMHRGMSLGTAMEAPRVHATLSGRVMVERRAAKPEVLERLARHFDPIEIKAARSYAMGGVQAIAWDEHDGWTGAADPRREGTSGAF